MALNHSPGVQSTMVAGAQGSWSCGISNQKQAAMNVMLRLLFACIQSSTQAQGATPIQGDFSHPSEPNLEIPLHICPEVCLPDDGRFHQADIQFNFIHHKAKNSNCSGPGNSR